MWLAVLCLGAARCPGRSPAQCPGSLCARTGNPRFPGNARPGFVTDMQTSGAVAKFIIENRYHYIFSPIPPQEAFCREDRRTRLSMWQCAMKAILKCGEAPLAGGRACSPIQQRVDSGGLDRVAKQQGSHHDAGRVNWAGCSATLNWPWHSNRRTRVRLFCISHPIDHPPLAAIEDSACLTPYATTRRLFRYFWY